MNKTFSRGLALGLAAVVSLPVSAATRDSDGDVTSVISRPMIYRDSDGDVISVICGVWVEDGMVLYSFTGEGPKVDLPVAEISNALGGPETALTRGSATTIRAGGQAFVVEARDDGLLLRDVATDAVYRGDPVRQVVRDGRVMRANPRSFALD